MLKDGRLYYKLLKTLMGVFRPKNCGLRNGQKLRGEGYQHSPVGPCVMRHIERDVVYLLLIYVNDNLLLAEQREIE
jgi:hypothetical protein